MGRVSQAQAQENRKRIVETASRLFREQGTRISVADVMKACGLTHGGFYKQFASKEALIDEATTQAFGELTRRRRTAEEEQYAQERESAQRALIDTYLSVPHRDDPADGCPAAGLAADMARGLEGSRARHVYTEGIRDFADWLGTDDQDGLTRLSTMIGALLLARATAGSPLSEEILTAAHDALTAAD